MFGNGGYYGSENMMTEIKDRSRLGMGGENEREKKRKFEQ